ncbi:MAG: CubicO group peptidase (beta-lactamase class C family) [Sphingobacteriales bacterium]|jgi:CubicO group peptidase (beta-lactamase class C family)
MRKFFNYLMVILILTNIVIFITGHSYIYKALVYQQPNIDDLEIFETRLVEASDDFKEWPTFPDFKKAELSYEFESTLNKFESVAFLIVQDDSILIEKYWDGYGPESLSNPFSAAKSVVATLIGIAIKDGHLTGVDQPISEILNEFNEKGREKTTIKDVLNMTSGLSFSESYSTPFNHTTDAYYGTDLKKLIYSLDMVEEPGTKWRYKSADTQVLAMIIEKSTNMSLSDYASKRLWKPLGMKHNAQWSLDKKDGIEKAYCCLYSNARDFARFGKFWLDSGIVDSVSLISKDFFNSAITPVMLPDDEGVIVDNYGYQWWLMSHRGYKINYCRGILGQYIVCIPKLNAVMVRLGHRRSEEKINGHPAEVITYIDETINILEGK